MKNKDNIVEVLRIVRKKIEEVANAKELNFPDESIQRVYYCFGVRDACWTIDDLISKVKNEGKL